MELALEIERAARAHEGVSQVENAVYSDAEGSVSLVNSRGFATSFEATQAWAYASAFAGEGQDLMTGLGVGLGRDPEALDPKAIGDEAAQRALALMGARRPESRRCPVVLDAFVAASFLGFIGVDAVRRGRAAPAARCSPGARGQVADPALALVDDGSRPDGPGSAPFDGEGVAHAANAADRGRAAARVPVRRAHGAQGEHRDDRQRGPRLRTARRHRSGPRVS